MLRAEYVQRRSTVHVGEVQEIPGVQDPGGPGDPVLIRGVRAHGPGGSTGSGARGGLGGQSVAIVAQMAGCGWLALVCWRWL